MPDVSTARSNHARRAPRTPQERTARRREHELVGRLAGDVVRQRGPLVETVKTDATGRAHVVEMCAECGGDDLAERVRAEVEGDAT